LYRILIKNNFTDETLVHKLVRTSIYISCRRPESEDSLGGTVNSK